MPKPSLTFVTRQDRTNVNPRYVHPAWTVTTTLVSRIFTTRVQQISFQTKTIPVGGKYSVPTAYAATYEESPPCWSKSVSPDNGSVPPRPTAITWEVSGVPLISDGREEAVSRCAHALASAIKGGSPNLAVALAEHKQTSSLLVTNAARVVRGLSSVSRLRFRDAYDALNIVPTSSVSEAAERMTRTYRGKGPVPKVAIANFWLEIQYGWKPLLSDVYASAEKLNRRAQSGSQFRYVAMGTSRRYADFRVNGRVLGTGAVTHTARAVTYLRMGADDVARLEANFLGISNPALVVWELVPYSFVVDWFLPIGQYLDSWGTLKNVNLAPNRSSYTVKSISNSEYGGVYPEPALGPKGYVEIENVKRKRVSIERTLGLPGIALPAFKNPVSWQHAANALALVLSNNPLKRKY